MHHLKSLLVAAALSAFGYAALADSATITISADKPGVKVSPMLYGVFFEEINRAGDGGIYAEMVQNRNFEDNAQEPAAWTITKDGDAAATIDSSQPLNDKNQHALKLEPKQGKITLANEGFKGLAVKKGESYLLSLYARGGEGFGGSVDVSILNKEGKPIASATISGIGGEWKKYEAKLTADDTEAKAKLALTAAGSGTVWLDMVSLFPEKSWKNRPNGLRPDLAEKVAALKPAFVRFPGGCWVEGDRMKDAYRWKETIGDVSERRNQYNLWRYHSTHGLGFHEYLQMSEDLGAEPLFVINCGMSHKENVPLDQLGEYVQDALDAIEYANGPVDSKWGALRAAAGHPEPFNLKYMQIGNENGGGAYDERYARFYDAIKGKYPQMNIIANFWANSVPKSRPVEILDEHYYSNPQFFINNANRYDGYDRNRYKIYVGEYACTSGCGQGNLAAAVGEAAFMTGLERNGDVVVMGSYAPLFAHVDYKAWNPDAICFDATRSYGTPSYWVQHMFANNRADTIYPVEIQAQESQEAHGGAVGLGTWITQAEYKDVKVTVDGKEALSSDFSKGLEGWKSLSGEWKPQAADKTLQQTTDKEACYIVAGDPKWSNYTITLKARKLGGREGFLIRFHSVDEKNFAMWNIGGYGNTRHQFEVIENGGTTPIGPGKRGSVETGKWYDIKVEVKDDVIRCFLDGQLIEEARYPKPRPLFAVAGRAGNDLVLKVVNASARPQETMVSVAGVSGIQPTVTQLQLTSGNLADENSLNEPEKVVPVESKFSAMGASFHATFPPNSVTVLRAALGQ